MRFPLLHLAVLFSFLLAGCGTSRPTEPAPSDEVGAFSLARGEDGSIQVQVGEDMNAETLMAAMQAAATLAAWNAPTQAKGLTLTGSEYRGPEVGIIYSYDWDMPDGRFNVYVYAHETDGPTQIAETMEAMEQLVSAGRFDTVELAAPPTSRQMAWGDGEATVHIARFRQGAGDLLYDSHFYLVESGEHWVKVRATVPEGEVAPESVEALAVAVLEDGA